MKIVTKIVAQKKDLLLLGLLVVLAIPALLPLFHPGFFVTDDGEWMIIRLSSFYQALHDGQFPVRFLGRLNFEYGYPVATFLYPGFMYVGVLLHVAKLSFVTAIKVILGLSLVGTTLFTYMWLRKVFTKKSAAFLGAFVSLYLPYHLYDVYTRGSVGEVFALLWVPFTLWMIERKNIFFISFGIGLLLLSHNTLGLLFLPVLFLYALLRKVALKEILISFSGGVFLSAFFIVPAIFELSLTQFSKTVIADPTHYLAKLSLIGLATCAVIIVSCVLYLFKKQLQKEHKGLLFFFLLISFFAALLSSAYAVGVWQIIPSSFIQFPFRLLSYLVVSLSFLTACLIAETDKKVKYVLIGGIILLSVFSSYQFLTPKAYTAKGEGFYVTNEATTTVQDEYMPLWVQHKPTTRPQEKVVIKDGSGQIANIVSTNKKVSFTFAAKEKSVVTINTIYWPGWEIFVDNNRTNFSYNNPIGVMQFTVQQGTHAVVGVFHETAIRLISDLISLLAFIVLLGIAFQAKKKKS